MLKASRARERRLHSGMQDLISEANRVRTAANEDLDDDDQLPILDAITDYWRADDMEDEDLDREVLDAPPE